MKRPQLEHVLRAAARIVNQPDFLVVGSAAILATYDEADLAVASRGKRCPNGRDSRHPSSVMRPRDHARTSPRTYQPFLAHKQLWAGRLGRSSPSAGLVSRAPYFVWQRGGGGPGSQAAAASSIGAGSMLCMATQNPATGGSCARAPVGDTIDPSRRSTTGRDHGRRRGVGDGLGAIRMQPDALGLALATSVLAVVIASFGLVSRVVSGAVAGLSYAFGLAVARGIAEWATCESTAHAVPTRGPGDAPPGTGGDRDEAGTTRSTPPPWCWPG